MGVEQIREVWKFDLITEGKSLWVLKSKGWGLFQQLAPSISKRKEWDLLWPAWEQNPL